MCVKIVKDPYVNVWACIVLSLFGYPVPQGTQKWVHSGTRCPHCGYSELNSLFGFPLAPGTKNLGSQFHMVATLWVDGATGYPNSEYLVAPGIQIQSTRLHQKPKFWVPSVTRNQHFGYLVPSET